MEDNSKSKIYMTMKNSSMARIYMNTCICVSRDGHFVMDLHIRRNSHGIEYEVSLISGDSLKPSTFKKNFTAPKKDVRSQYLRRQLATA